MGSRNQTNPRYSLNRFKVSSRLQGWPSRGLTQKEKTDALKMMAKETIIGIYAIKVLNKYKYFWIF